MTGKTIRILDCKNGARSKEWGYGKERNEQMFRFDQTIQGDGQPHDNPCYRFSYNQSKYMEHGSLL